MTRQLLVILTTLTLAVLAGLAVTPHPTTATSPVAIAACPTCPPCQATTPTRTITPAPTPTPPPAHAANKKGVAGGDSLALTQPVNAGWGYDWYVNPAAFAPGYEYVPMIRTQTYNADNVTATARAHPGSYWLIWNEPDYYRSANIKATDAAVLYHTLRPLILGQDPTAKLIVGGVFNLNLQWLQDFRTAYKTAYGAYPVVEGWHVHHYQGRTEYVSATWRSQLANVQVWMSRNGGAVELWLTEVGCLNSGAVDGQMMKDQIPWLEAQSWLTRYSWFSATATNDDCSGCTRLFNDDGTLTDLGQIYKSLP